MKLSKNGFHKVLQTCRFDEDRATYVLKYSEALKDYFFEVEGTEFESDDFENVVCLTVEEAKQIVDSLHRAIKAHVEVSRLTNGWTEVSTEENDIYMLKEKIEQAEKP